MNYRGKINRLIESALSLHTPWLCRWEYRRQKHTIFNERPIEFSFVFKAIGKYYPLNVLDVGTGKTALPHLIRNCGCLVTATDNITDYWDNGMRNRHYHIIDDDICNTKITSEYDLVTCVSVLEHIVNHQDAVSNMLKLLKPGGHLVLTCPYTENSYAENVYKQPGSTYGQNASYTTQSYSRNELDAWLSKNNGTVVDQEYWQYWDGEYWTVGKQIIPPVRVAVEDKHQLTCLLIRKNS